MMNKIGKKYYFFFILFLVIFIASAYSIVNCKNDLRKINFSYPAYIYHVGTNQISLLLKREKIKTLLRQKNLSQALKERFLLLEELRDFARINLKLKVDETYRHFVQLDRPYLAWNLTSSKKYSLEAKLWTFPILGRVPYLGFFDKKKAIELSQNLEKQGWDTELRPILAYSTLGWFNDPLFSPQVALSELSFVNLFLHESTHKTLWITNEVDFNEGLANFVAEKGTLYYAEKKYGKASKQYKEILARNERGRKYRDLHHKYVKKLQAVYKNKNLDRNVKEEKRQEIFRKIKIEWGEILERERKQEQKERKSSLGLSVVNNAYFIKFLTYNKENPLFSALYISCKEDWNCFFRELPLALRKKKHSLSLDDSF